MNSYNIDFYKGILEGYKRTLHKIEILDPNELNLDLCLLKSDIKQSIELIDMVISKGDEKILINDSTCIS